MSCLVCILFRGHQRGSLAQALGAQRTITISRQKEHQNTAPCDIGFSEAMALFWQKLAHNGATQPPGDRRRLFLNRMREFSVAPSSPSFLSRGLL